MGLIVFQTKPTARVLRQFAAAWLIFFLLQGANQIWRRGHVHAGIALGIVAVIGIVGLIKPSAVRLLFIAASAAAFPIGWVVSQVALVIMFYGVVTPMALWFRMRGRDTLQLRAKPDQSSFWVSREKEPAPERYLKQF
ncbi:MAG TPA: hypothetical protein VH597_00905 [Verrucomicrobiae bacterium]|jgi:hypothetical protein|nr:hypothetical protein [Verrucomicrobiae bacterium]